MKNLIFVLMLISLSANAGDGDWYNWLEPLTIKDIRVQGDRNIISFRTNEPHQNPNPACNTGYYVLESEELTDELLSFMLAAKLANHPIGININATKCGPYGRVVVTQVRIL